MAVDAELATGCTRIVEALCAVPGDRAVIVTDRSRVELARQLAETAQATRVRVSLHVLEDHGARPFLGLPPAIRADLNGAQASVLWIGIEQHAEIPIRRELVGLVPELRLRHAHLLGLSRQALAEAFGATAPRIADTTRRVRGRVRPSSTITFRSAAGSNLEVRLDPAYRWGEHAGIIREGHWENLPSGLLMTHAPRVSGTFVANGSLMGRFAGHTGSLARSPIAFVIEDGRCMDVRCADGALGSAVRAHLASEGDLDRVGLVVLGTNVGIQRPLGELLVDQCAPGLHLTFGFTGGDDTGASWCSRGILTVTSAGGDVDLDGAPLVRGGRLLGL